MNENIPNKQKKSYTFYTVLALVFFRNFNSNIKKTPSNKDNIEFPIGNNSFNAKSTPEYLSKSIFKKIKGTINKKDIDTKNFLTTLFLDLNLIISFSLIILFLINLFIKNHSIIEIIEDIMNIAIFPIIISIYLRLIRN